jgi:hypothetical protein
MGGEGVERHVGDDPELREARLEGTGRPLGQGIRVVGLFRQQTLLSSGVTGNRATAGTPRATSSAASSSSRSMESLSTPGMEATASLTLLPPARTRDR